MSGANVAQPWDAKIVHRRTPKGWSREKDETMPQSLAKVLARTVSSTKHLQPRLHDPIRRPKLYADKTTFGAKNGDIGGFVRAAPLGLLAYAGRLPRVA